MRGSTPLISGVRGSPPGKFLKLDCLRVRFQAIFMPISVLLQTNFKFMSAISNVIITRFLQTQHSGVNNIEDILATSDTHQRLTFI